MAEHVIIKTDNLAVTFNPNLLNMGIAGAAFFAGTTKGVATAVGLDLEGVVNSLMLFAPIALGAVYSLYMNNMYEHDTIDLDFSGYSLKDAPSKYLLFLQENFILVNTFANAAFYAAAEGAGFALGYLAGSTAKALSH